MTNINTFQGDVFIHEYIKHSGDDNNLFGFSGTDTFKIATAGVDAIKVDADQNVDITGLIRHIGDENNLFGFSGTDTFKIATAGSDRLTVGSDGAVTVANDLFVSEYIKHSGDTDTYFGFNAANSWLVRTNGSDRISVNNAGNVTLGVNLYIPDYIYHSGDTNTYFGFNGGDSMVFITGGTTRLTINTSGLYTQSGGTALNYFKETTNGGSWTALGQNGTGFNINGQIAYQRVGNFCTAMARRVQFYAQGNFYLRHTVPSEFRPSHGGDILAWTTRVTTNGAFFAQAYYQNPYMYSVYHPNGSHFPAGGGTQHNFSAWGACWSV
jgi:hypothetical protein|uniref:Uncharacterized protein n=1 Tax=viral metagenome TaxID=1070528 RepID=A0A6C0JFN5_9ZZZZ